MFHVEHLLLRLVSYTQKHFSKTIFYVGPDDSVRPFPWYSGWTESSIPTEYIMLLKLICSMWNICCRVYCGKYYVKTIFKHFFKTIFYVGPDDSVWPLPWYSGWTESYIPTVTGSYTNKKMFHVEHFLFFLLALFNWCLFWFSSTPWILFWGFLNFFY